MRTLKLHYRLLAKSGYETIGKTETKVTASFDWPFGSKDDDLLAWSRNLEFVVNA